jgi:hypothetical protein
MNDSNSPSPFTFNAIAIMLAIALISFSAVIVLAGWAPELRDKDEAGEHPYSTSALGYNGFAQLLAALDYPVEISRLERKLEDRDWGLMIVTTAPWSMRKRLEETELQPSTLIVLPKWQGQPDWSNPKRQIDTQFVAASQINDLLGVLEIEGELGRIKVPSNVTSPFGTYAPRPDLKMQVLRSNDLETIVETPDGALLARMPDEDIYILADPDLINTFGLAEKDNARFSIAMIDWLRYDETEPIYLDATLHGFTRSANLLQMAFDIPFIGATLTAFATALLLGWAAMMRFGPPLHEGRVIALGKQALADNSAGLVAMARSEVHMAPRYLTLMRRQIAKDIGAPKTLTETQLTALFDQLGPESASGKTFSQIQSGLIAAAASREDLIQKTRELYRWRHQIIGRSVHERH